MNEAVAPGERMGTAPVGIQMSGATTLVPRNVSAATPTTVNGRLFNHNGWPTILRSPLNRRIQNRWLSTASAALPSSPSVAAKRRPAAADTPSTAK